MNKYLKVPTHNPNVCIRILQLNTANPFRRSVMAGPSLLQPPPCRGGVISVHHDPVHGIGANPGNREWVPYPLSFSVVCPNPVHRVLVNWDPPISQYLGQPGGKQITYRITTPYHHSRKINTSYFFLLRPAALRGMYSFNFILSCDFE